jgi:hypothetical protein
MKRLEKGIRNYDYLGEPEHVIDQEKVINHSDKSSYRRSSPTLNKRFVSNYTSKICK